MTILTEIISILVGGFTEFASGFGAGLSTLATNIFLDGTGDTQKLSVFGTIVVVFAGLSLVMGLSRWVLNFITSLGARNR